MGVVVIVVVVVVLEMVDFEYDGMVGGGSSMPMSSLRSSDRKMSPGLAFGEFGLQPNNLVVVVLAVGGGVNENG
jgi:hypothetical protein